MAAITLNGSFVLRPTKLAKPFLAARDLRVAVENPDVRAYVRDHHALYDMWTVFCRVPN
jgi:hypothetical protein